MNSNPVKLIILDRDGVINHDSDQYIKTPEEWVPIPGSLEAIALLNQSGYHVVVASNQSGVGRGLFDMSALIAMHTKLHRALAHIGGRIDAIFFCPHAADDGCSCRKPKPGLLREIGRRYGTDLSQVPFASDTLRDLLAAQAAGCEPHLVQTGRAAALSDEQLEDILQQVPQTRVHDNLAAFADFLLRRGEVHDSASGDLS